MLRKYVTNLTYLGKTATNYSYNREEVESRHISRTVAIVLQSPY
jgi:hypothetical protein